MMKRRHEGPPVYSNRATLLQCLIAMSDWSFAQSDPRQQLAKLHHFSSKKRHGELDVEFLITVREYLSPPDPAMKFFALADKQTNQKVSPYTPSGWGNTLLTALSECLREIERFPYQGE
jgi:hypothetical protein